MQLLAKSFHGSTVPEEATLFGHLRAVHASAVSILDTCGDSMLAAFDIPARHLDRFRKLLAMAAALHDVGKANSHFQGMLAQSEERSRYSFRQALRHEWVSLLWLQQLEVQPWIREVFKSDADLLTLECCICGHHPGAKRPTPPASIEGAGSEMATYFHEQAFDEIADWLQQLSASTQKPILPEWTLKFDATSANDPNVSLARWHMRANTRFENLSTVDKRLVAAAKACMVAADVAGSALTERQSSPQEQHQWIRSTLAAVPKAAQIEELVKERLNGFPERPFQSNVASSTSRVTLVTAGCGCGKTVAAWLWAARQCPGQRVFFSYPTTGTATEGFRGYLFDHDSQTSKLGADLFHSRAQVDFEVILDVIEDGQAEAIAEEQLRIYSLKSWSTPIICCTVDTVLGIIQNHRRGLYSWPALAQSAFVFDEIHAYDDKLFGCLLRFLSDLRGTKVLLMTASLPTPRLAAIQQALDDEEPASIIVGPPELEQLPRYHREQPDDIDARVREELDCGGRVLWICNVVDRAMEVADRFSDWNLLIYHSRFRYEDRVQRHKDVVAAFSPGSSQNGSLAICTQVAEMSLDISATLLVTELAPVPSLIQRLGRLNRHAKPADPPPVTMPFAVDYPRKESGAIKEMPYSFEVYGDWPQVTESWLSQLGDQNISQQSLADAWENLNSDREIEGIDSNWIDGGPTTQIDSVRTASPGVTVVRAGADADACLADSSRLARVSIPMPQPYSKGWTGWPRIKGVLIAPEDTLIYDSQRGAKWQK
ncbi:MAG: CRISPR-associated helicase Cas3' [Planctomycetaceae bacterium]